MMKIKKILSLSIIFLFIGVVVVPSINFNLVKASTDNDLVEVTTQACGIKGYGDTTVKLTREQYNELEQYLVDFRARLNQTTTREESIPIFKDAVVELDKYGLLPKGMSVEQAQKFVSRELYFTKISYLLERIISLRYKNNDIVHRTNIFCLVYAHTIYSRDFRYVFYIFFIIALLGEYLGTDFFTSLVLLIMNYVQLNQLKLMINSICSAIYYYSLGLNGIVDGGPYENDEVFNIIRFSGIKITYDNPTREAVYIGFALALYTSTEDPPKSVSMLSL
jgi:hypothetical protein